MASKTADAIKLVLRLPKALHKRLTQQARRNNVSLNTEIINQLEGHEAATVERAREIIKPMIEEATRKATAKALFFTLAALGRKAAHPDADKDLLARIERFSPEPAPVLGAPVLGPESGEEQK